MFSEFTTTTATTAPMVGCIAEVSAILSHSDCLTEVENGKSSTLLRLRSLLPALVAISLGSPGCEKETALKARQLLCGGRDPATRENPYGSCGVVWNAHAARLFLTDEREMVERMGSDMVRACEALEGILPDVATLQQMHQSAADEGNVGAFTTDCSCKSLKITSPPSIGRVCETREGRRDTTSRVHESQPLPPPVAASHEYFIALMDTHCHTVRTILGLLEALLVAVVLDNIYLEGGGTAQIPLDDHAPFVALEEERVDTCKGRLSPLRFIVDHAVRAFTHVFLSITSVQHQLHQMRCAHGGTPSSSFAEDEQLGGHSPLSVRSQSPSCSRCRRLEKELSRRMEMNLHVLKMSAVAFVAHDTDLAEAAIECIDSRGPVFTAQATMLLAHVLTPQLLSAHPTASRGGKALKWVLSFVFDGCNSSDVGRVQVLRRSHFENGSNRYSLANSSVSSPSRSPEDPNLRLGSGNGNDSSSEVSAAAPLSDESEGVGQYSSAALRVEYILAACFTRCHPLMTVIGVIAESDAYECGLVVAKAVLQYAVTLSLTSAYFLRYPLVGPSWITPFTQAMMRGIDALAYKGGKLPLGSDDAEDSNESFATSWCTSGDDEDTVPKRTAKATAASAAASGRYRFRPHARAKVSGKNTDDAAECPTDRTTRRSLAIHWAKCVVLSGRTLLHAGITKIAISRDHYETLHHQCQPLEAMMQAWQCAVQNETGGDSPLDGEHHNDDVTPRKASRASLPPSSFVEGLESARPFEAQQYVGVCSIACGASQTTCPRGRPSSPRTNLQSLSHSLLQPAPLTPPNSTTGLPRKLTALSSDCYTSMGEHESHQRVFLDSFCLGKSAQVFFVDAPYAVVPIHEVLFASLYTVLDAVGDVLLCEEPRLNSIVVNELLTLLYEVRLAMLEERLSGGGGTDMSAVPSENGAVNAALMDYPQLLPYQLIFPSEFSVLLNRGLRIREVVQRWVESVERDRSHPCTGFVSVLQDLERHLTHAMGPLADEVQQSRATLRLLLGVTAREDLAGSAGRNTLYVDDLDVVGSKKEDVMPPLGVTASRGIVIRSTDATESFVRKCDTPHALLLGGVLHEGPLLDHERRLRDSAREEEKEEKHVSRIGNECAPPLADVTLSMGLLRRQHHLCVVGTREDFAAIADRAPSTWQLPSQAELEEQAVTLESISHTTQRSNGTPLEVPFHHRDPKSGSNETAVNPLLHEHETPLSPSLTSRIYPWQSDTTPLLVIWIPMPVPSAVSILHSTMQRRSFTDFPLFCRQQRRQEKEHREVVTAPPEEDVEEKLSPVVNDGKDAMRRDINLSNLPYTRRLLESGCFGPPGGNRSFSFFVDPGGGVLSADAAADKQPAQSHATVNCSGLPVDCSPLASGTASPLARTRASSLPASPRSATVPADNSLTFKERAAPVEPETKPGSPSDGRHPLRRMQRSFVGSAIVNMGPQLCFRMRGVPASLPLHHRMIHLSEGVSNEETSSCSQQSCSPLGDLNTSVGSHLST